MCFLSLQSQVISSTLPRFPTIAPMTSIMMDSMYWELIPFMGPAETYLLCYNGIVTHATSSKVDRSFLRSCPYLPIPYFILKNWPLIFMKREKLMESLRKERCKFLCPAHGIHSTECLWKCPTLGGLAPKVFVQRGVSQYLISAGWSNTCWPGGWNWANRSGGCREYS